MELTPALVVAAAVTAGGALYLVLSERRRTHRWSVPVLWTALLALVVGAAFVLLGPFAWGVAAPGLLIWCATVVTRGRPGVLIEAPPSPADGASRRAQRARRRHGRATGLFFVLVVVVAALAAALAWAAATGRLPWTS